MTNDTLRGRIIRESTSRTERHTITVLELDTGEVVMYADDRRTGIQEDIALREYVDANEIYYDFDEGWMTGNSEIPYQDTY